MMETTKIFGATIQRQRERERGRETETKRGTETERNRDRERQRELSSEITERFRETIQDAELF